MDKQAQRIEIWRRLKKLPEDYCRLADEAIFSRIINLKEYREAPLVFCYVSVGREIDIRPVIENAWASGKRVAVPKCIGKGIMEAFEIHSWQDLTPGSYGIPEPKAFCMPVKPSEIAFAVIPCLSCDREGNRLGHGGGYYDRYLSEICFFKAAVCRERQLLEHVCRERHDLPVDLVITEAKIYKPENI